MTVSNRKRKKNSKAKNNYKINWEIIGIVLIIFGMLSFLSLISDKMGILGKGLDYFYIVSFGSGNLIFPLMLIFYGIILIPEKFVKIRKKYIVLTFIISLCVLIILDRNNTAITLMDKINLSIDSKDIVRNGGIVGAVLGFFFYHLFGTVGTYFLVGAVILVCLYYLLDIKISFNLISIKEKLNNIISKAKNYRKPNPAKIKSKETRKNNKPRIKINEYNSQDKILVEEFENIQNKEIPTEEVEVIAKTENKDKVTTKKTEGSLEKENIETIALENKEYVFPSINLLNRITSKGKISNDAIIKNGEIIEQTMENFNIDCKVTQINKGPSITCYELEPAPGVKLSKIVSLSDNLAMNLASPEIRIEAPIPGKKVVGIEVPNVSKDPVGIREIIESREFKNLDSNLPLALGKDVSGNTIISSIDKMPHLLIAGATGSGKSVCINGIITSILYKASPEDVRLMLIDPKVVELSVYNGIPHLLIPVVTDAKKAAFALNWAVEEMEKRYKAFAKNGVRDVASYNSKVEKMGLNEEKFPKIVIIVDELADLMMVAANEVEDYICRLAQMARAAGMYLILATQRPSVDVITGTIKANIPSRIAFSVSSSVDSRTILDMGGAEKLLGKGDMLFYPPFYAKPKRIQGAFISDEEVEKVVNSVKVTDNEIYEEEVVQAIDKKKEISLSDRDSLIDEAIKIVLSDEQASISYLQRKLKVGYSRAARIVDQMEEMGIIGPHEGAKPRKLLLTDEEIKSYMGEIDE